MDSLSVFRMVHWRLFDCGLAIEAVVDLVPRDAEDIDRAVELGGFDHDVVGVIGRYRKDPNLGPCERLSDRCEHARQCELEGTFEAEEPPSPLVMLRRRAGRNEFAPAYQRRFVLAAAQAHKAGGGNLDHLSFGPAIADDGVFALQNGESELVCHGATLLGRTQQLYRAKRKEWDHRFGGPTPL